MAKKRKIEEQREERKKVKEANKLKRKRDVVQKKVANRRQDRKKVQTEWICLECEAYYATDDGEDDWIECSKCQNWFHLLCAGLEELTPEELASLDFVCSLCS